MCGPCCVQATATNAIDNARNNRVATCIRPIASNNASSDTSFVTAAHPSTGGIAPAAPPMTMFCGVGRLEQHTIVLPTNVASVNSIVSGLTKRSNSRSPIAPMDAGRTPTFASS